ncbi:MAG: MFS transporter [Acidimicrobiales bacterium]|nr:MFS transporter [Acidimicrobiales bacterium]
MSDEHAALRDIPRKLWAYLLSRLLDTAATSGLVFIVGKQIYDMTEGRPEEQRLLYLGYLGLVQFIPTFVFAPFAGSLADRFDRRLVSAGGAAIYALLAMALYAYVRTDPTALAPIYVLMAVQGTTEAFQRPAARALPMDLSPETLITRVMALNAASWQTGAIVGPVLAGFLFATAIALPYLVFTAMFAVATISLLAIPPTEVERLKTDRRGGGQAIRDAIEGFRFIRKTPVLGAAISLDLFAVLFGGAVALLPAIADERLGVDAVGLGWLRAAISIGAASVTLTLAARPLSRRVGPILLWSVAVFGAGTIVLGITRNFVVAMIALLVLGGADSVSVFIRSTLVPLATPENMRGRVLALENVFIGASNELGGFESGATGALFGLVGAVIFGGAATLGVVAVFAFVFPALRHVDSFSDVRKTVTPALIPSVIPSGGRSDATEAPPSA